MDNTSSNLQKLQATISNLQSQNLQQFQKGLLANLYQLRQALLQDIQNLGNITNATAASEESAKDIRIAELEAENKRLNYRILHLSRNLKEKL